MVGSVAFCKASVDKRMATFFFWEPVERVCRALAERESWESPDVLTRLTIERTRAIEELRAGGIQSELVKCKEVGSERSEGNESKEVEGVRYLLLGGSAQWRSCVAGIFILVILSQVGVL